MRDRKRFCGWQLCTQAPNALADKDAAPPKAHSAAELGDGHPRHVAQQPEQGHVRRRVDHDVPSINIQVFHGSISRLSGLSALQRPGPLKVKIERIKD